MRLTARLLVFSLLLPAVAAADPMPRAGWIGLKAPNFYVIGDVGQRDLREVTRHLEQFREAIGIIFPKAILSTSTPTTVLVFKSHKNYEPVKPLYQGKIKKNIAGYFQPGRSLNYVTFTMEEGIEQLDIVYRRVRAPGGEQQHHRRAAVVQRRPRRVLPHVPDHRQRQARDARQGGRGPRAAAADHFIPLADLVKVDHKSPLYNESARQSIFYAESWALVHYLLLGEQQKYVSHAGSFVAALADGASFEDACQRQLGLTGDQLQQLLTRYIRGDMFPMQSARFTERIGKIDDLPVTPVSEAEVHATLGDVLLNMGRTADARVELDRAVALDAGYAPAHTSLGMVASRENREDDARKELEMAAGLPTATYVSQFEFANALAQSWANPAPGDGEKIEKALRRAIELNPSFPDAYEMLAWKLGQNEASLDEAMRLVNKALDLAPGREAYVFRKAVLLANKQDFTAARSLLTQIIRGGSDETVRANAQRELAQVDDFERRKAAFEANRTASTPRRRHRQLSRRDSRPAADRAGAPADAARREPGLRQAHRDSVRGDRRRGRRADARRGDPSRACHEVQPDRIDHVPQRPSRRCPVWRQGRRRPRAAYVHAGRQQHEFREGGCCGVRAARLHALTASSVGIADWRRQ